jgi:hypothetical protein
MNIYRKSTGGWATPSTPDGLRCSGRLQAGGGKFPTTHTYAMPVAERFRMRTPRKCPQGASTANACCPMSLRRGPASATACGSKVMRESSDPVLRLPSDKSAWESRRFYRMKKSGIYSRDSRAELEKRL